MLVYLKEKLQEPPSIFNLKIKMQGRLITTNLKMCTAPITRITVMKSAMALEITEEAEEAVQGLQQDGWQAGALVQDFLEQQGIRITAYVKQIGKAVLQAPPKSYTAKDIEANLVRCPEMETAQHMIAEIEEAKSENDSLGGVIECVVEGLTPGIGKPSF
jgi:hypothetical protein